MAGLYANTVSNSIPAQGFFGIQSIMIFANPVKQKKQKKEYKKQDDDVQELKPYIYEAVMHRDQHKHDVVKCLL